MLKFNFTFNNIFALFKIMGLIYGLTYFQLQINQEGIQNFNALIFLTVMYVSVIHLYSVINVS
jgi:hypothetical protein